MNDYHLARVDPLAAEIDGIEKCRRDSGPLQWPVGSGMLLKIGLARKWSND